MFIAGCQDADEDVAREAITATTAFMSSICVIIISIFAILSFFHLLNILIIFFLSGQT
jgi:hypothetical protein